MVKEEFGAQAILFMLLLFLKIKTMSFLKIIRLFSNYTHLKINFIKEKLKPVL